MGRNILRREILARTCRKCALAVAFLAVGLSPCASAPAAGRSAAIHIPDTPIVRAYINSYTGIGKERIEQIWQRASIYCAHILRQIQLYGLPVELVYLPVVESGYDTEAVSRSGAVGLWQLMENTATYFGLRMDSWVDERRDFWSATDASLRKLKENFTWFGDWYLALAAYNCGLGKLTRIIKQAGTRDFWVLRSREYLPVETAEYVPRFLAIAKILASPGTYGIMTHEEEPIDWTRIRLDGPVDLEAFSIASGIPLDLLRLGNAGLMSQVTPPDGQGYWLKLPESQWYAGIRAVQQLGQQDLPFQVHTVRTGDTFYALSLHYGVAVDVFMEYNQTLDARNLRPGDKLLVPVLDGVSKPPPRYDRPTVTAFDVVYRIRKGDTLWAIALRHGITPEQLAEANGIELNGILNTGDAIRVPSGG